MTMAILHNFFWIGFVFAVIPIVLLLFPRKMCVVSMYNEYVKVAFLDKHRKIVFCLIVDRSGSHYISIEKFRKNSREKKQKKRSALQCTQQNYLALLLFQNFLKNVSSLCVCALLSAITAVFLGRTTSTKKQTILFSNCIIIISFCCFQLLLFDRLDKNPKIKYKNSSEK